MFDNETSNDLMSRSDTSTEDDFDDDSNSTTTSVMNFRIPLWLILSTAPYIGGVTIIGATFNGFILWVLSQELTRSTAEVVVMNVAVCGLVTGAVSLKFKLVDFN